MAETLTQSLQESVLTLLATNDVEGRIAAGLIDHRSFDDSYRELAQRIFSFRKKHGKAPGTAHLDDLVDDIIGNKKHKQQRQYLRILDGILSNADSLNAPYVLSRIHGFAKRQRFKYALLKAGDYYQTGKDDVEDVVEDIFKKAIKPDTDSTLELGTFLSDKKKALNFLHSAKADYLLGIPALDRVNLGPTAGELLMLMAAKGKGKSWWAIDVGKRCLMQNAKVLHVTLEMSEDRVIQRYFQSFFAIAKRREKFFVTDFEFDDLGRVAELKRHKRKPRMALDSSKIERYLHRKMRKWGTRLGRLVVKGFPSGSLTIPKLEAYLELLEIEGFIPNVMIVDYPDLMALDKKGDLRVSIGLNTKELRGLCQKRYLAGVAPTQGNRKSWDASTAKGSMVSEDASKFYTADKVLIYNQTPLEKALGLARLDVEKNRDDEDGFTVAITQAYKTGQFCLNSTRMFNQQHYWDMLGAEGDDMQENDEEEDTE
jgi:hypothetical protein